MRKVKVKYLLVRRSETGCGITLEKLYEVSLHPDTIPAEGKQVVLPDSDRVRQVVAHRHRYTKTGLREIAVLVRQTRRSDLVRLANV